MLCLMFTGSHGSAYEAASIKRRNNLGYLLFWNARNVRMTALCGKLGARLGLALVLSRFKFPRLPWWWNPCGARI